MPLTKKEIHRFVEEFVQSRIDSSLDQLNELQQSKEGDTKSSAGDKFETSREMLQQEEDKIKRMLLQGYKMKQDLDALNPEENKPTIGAGSIVKTNRGSFYISIGIGKLPIENESIFCISMGSPIGLLLKGQVAGNDVSFNGNTFSIQQVN